MWRLLVLKPGTVVLAAVLAACGSDERGPMAMPTGDAGMDASRPMSERDTAMPDDASDPMPRDAEMDATLDEMDAALTDAEIPDAAVPLRHYPGPCEIETTRPGSDTVLSRQRFGYDALDRVDLEELDQRSTDGLPVADGVIDYRRETEYHPDGSPSRVAADWDGDGFVDLITTYDVVGNKLGEDWDVRDDGSQVDRTTFVYGSQGRLERVERDQDGDGALDALTAHTYDSDDRIIRIETDLDVDDGMIDDTKTFTYDGAGLLALEESRDASGTLLRQATWTYSDGRPVEKAYDEDGDGIADRAERWTYDGDGNLMTEERDEDADGAADLVRTFDGRGNLVSTLEYEDGELEAREAYTYDGSDRLLTQALFDDADNLVSRTAYGYLDNGELETIDDDDDGDGEYELSTRYTFTPEGMPLSRAISTSGPSGTFVVVESYVYDEEDNLRQHRIDTDGDGAVDLVETSSYGCW